MATADRSTVAARTGPQLRTGAWYGDRPLELPFPEDWQVTAHWPDTPEPVSDDEIARALEEPVGQPPIRSLARGRKRPLIVVDDLTRPTPATRLLPLVLRQLAEGGIAPEAVAILIASGTHRQPTGDGMAKKVGPEAAASCRLLAHDDSKGVARVGRTSFGTPVIVNRAVLESDFVLGIGGVYPQALPFFGGGSKLALGVLSKRSIMGLHYGHASKVDFRRDLDEIAALIGLETTIAAHIDPWREIVRVVSGDHNVYYEDAAAFSKRAYGAPAPTGADVVVVNAYPMDGSLTFLRKGIGPLAHAPPSASRIVVAACTEGIGHHGLFPFMNGPRFARQTELLRRARARPGAIPLKAARRAAKRLGPLAPRRWAPAPRPAKRPAAASAVRPVWLHPTDRDPGSLPSEIPGMIAIHSWPQLIEHVAREQGGRDTLQVVVYPCAPLQVIAESVGGARTGVPPELETLE